MDALRLTRTLVPRAGEKTAPAPYLVVIQPGSSGVFHLPVDGVLVLGRGDEADLPLEDASVSRRHARLMMSNGQARVVDLDSHNGTKVNGEVIAETRALFPGDVVTLGEVTLVLRGAAPRKAHSPVVESGQLSERLGLEVSRSALSGRSASVIVAQVPQGEAPGAAAKLSLRPIDLVSPTSDRELRGVLPETSPDEAVGHAARWCRALGPHARAGVASFPVDGAEPDALWAAAFAAASSASEGKVRRASELATVLTIKDRRVLVADPAMVRLYQLLERLARSDLPVLVTGETGAGKENAAYAVHTWSRRAAGRFVTLNCAALTESLLESELFGHEKGAFTGAVAQKPGLLEQAAGGSIFLDEVGELSLSAQAKLLRAIETKRVTRVGATAEIEVDFRIVAATNRVLEDEVQAGRFRSDLYFRLSAATVVLPPLRERQQEIPLLAQAFLDERVAADRRGQLAFAPSAMRALCAYAWPGNVRELRNAVEYAAAAASDVIEAQHLPARVTAGAPAPVEPKAAPSAPRAFTPLADELRELEIRRMREALEQAGGVQTRAAELIGMPVRTFVFKLKRHGLHARPRA